MQVANLELCKELYELSGWTNFPYYWSMRSVNNFEPIRTVLSPTSPRLKTRLHNRCQYPAYDLGYLMRKLPPYVATYGEDGDDCLLQLRPNFAGDEWTAGYTTHDRYLHMAVAGAPEDAAAKLCIELIKQGVLNPKEHNHGE